MDWVDGRQLKRESFGVPAALVSDEKTPKNAEKGRAPCQTIGFRSAGKQHTLSAFI